MDKDFFLNNQWANMNIIFELTKFYQKKTLKIFNIECFFYFYQVTII